MDEFVIGLAGELEVDQTAKNIKNQLDSLSKQVNSDGAKRLSFIGKLNETKTIKVIQEQLDTMSNSLKFEIKSDGLQGIIDSLREVGKVLAQTSQSSDTSNIVNNINKETKSVKELESEYGKLASTRKKYNDIANKSPDVVTNTFRDGITTTQVTTNLASDKADTKVVTENFEAQEKALIKADTAAIKYSADLENLRKQYIGGVDVNTAGEQASSPILNADNLQKVKDKYFELSQEIENLRGKTGNEFTTAKANIEAKISMLNEEIKAYRKLESMGTTLRDRPIDIIKEEQLTQIEILNTEIKEMGLTSETSLSKFGSAYTSIGTVLEHFKGALQNIGSTDRAGMQKWLDDFGVFKKQIDALDEENKLTQLAEKSKSAFELLGAQITQVNQKIENSKFSDNPDFENFKTQIEAIKSQYDTFLESLNKSTNNGQNSEVLRDMASEIKIKTDEIKKSLDLTKASFTNFEKSAKDAFSKKTFEIDKSTFSNQIQIWLNENTAASERTRDAMKNLQKQIASANQSDLKLLKKQFADLRKEATATGDVGKSFFDTLKSNIAKFTGWYGIGNAIASIRREIVGAVSDLKEMDTLLTEISKTSDRTEMELQELGQSAYSAASGYGRTVQDYLSGVLEMSRAGYANSEAMAELSLKAQSAGDMTAELANQYLIATDAAYQLHGSEEQLSNILDGQNKITNLNAVNMTELAEATKIAASQSASAGVSVDEMTAAVGTMIATTQQGGAQAGRAWRSLLLNLTQVAGEVDATTGEVVNTEDLTKYEKAVNALGVSLKTVEDGAIKLRNPIEILKELSEAYNQLEVDDARRANLLSAVGGKYRANQLDALLKNFDTYEKMLQEFSEGTGSAAEEAEKTANSWEGSLNKFNNSITELTNNFVNSGNAKSVINFFTGLVQSVDKVTSAFGSLGTAVGIFSGIMISKAKSIHFSFDKDTQSIKLGEKALYQLADATRFQTIKAAALTVGMKALNAVINIGASLIIGSVVSAISSWINKEEELEQKHKEFIQELAETNNQYKETAQNAKEYLSTYKEILAKDEMTEEDRTRLLEIQNSILHTYGEQAKGIDLVNGKYQEQLGILTQISQGEYQRQAVTATQLINEAIETANDSADRILSYSYNQIDDYSRNRLKFRVGDEDYDSTDESGIEQAKQYIALLEDIQGLETERLKQDMFSKYGIQTFGLSVDSDLSAAETVDAVTSALERLYNIPRDERGTMFTQVESRLQEILKQAQTKVTNLNKLFNENLDALIGRVTTQTGINITNVTDETFKEWYDAVVGFYNTDQYSAEYQKAIFDWFDRNYTSVAQRIARGTTIAEIAYESEKAFRERAAMSSDNGVFGFSYEAYKEDIEAVTKEFKTLQGVIDKIDSGKYSAIEDGFGLLDAYPDLLQYINNTDVLRQKLVDLQTASPQDLVSNLQDVRANLEKIGNYKQIAQIDALIESLQSLGTTAEETAESLTAKDYLKIQQDGIDKIIDKLSEEKETLNDALDSLNERKSQIEDYYDTQINALKEENEEREKNIDLQEKQKALDNAKRNKVRVYSAARGFTIQEDSEAIAKAQQELDSAIKDNQVDELEKQRKSAVASIDAEIKAQKEGIKSKEDEINEWKDYKTKLTEETNAIIDQNTLYLEAQKQFVLDENSTFTDRENNLKAHLERIKAIINGTEEEATGNGLTTDAFGVAPQAAVNAILAMSGLSVTNPIPQSNSSNSKIKGTVNSQFAALAELALSDNNGAKASNINGGKNIDQTNNFAPSITINAQTVDDKVIKNWWQREINEEYSKFLVNNKQ